MYNGDVMAALYQGVIPINLRLYLVCMPREVIYLHVYAQGVPDISRILELQYVWHTVKHGVRYLLTLL